MIDLVLSSCGVQPAAATQTNAGATGGISTGTAAPAACPTPPAELLTALTAGSITEEDSGRTLVVHQTDRFSIYLNDHGYPLSKLQADPADRLGVISNGAIRGPNCYPIMFEAVSEGRAVLRDGNFELNVVVDNNAPTSQIPLP